MKILMGSISIALFIPNLGTIWGWLVETTSHQVTGKPFLGPTHSPIRWVQRFLSQAVKLTTHI